MTHIPDDDFETGAPALTRGAPRARPRATTPQRDEPVREDTRAADTRLTRSRKRSDDPLYVDPRVIPAGMSYEWKAESCYGEQNPSHIAGLEENHWSPVPADRHGKGIVVRKNGLVLMERPAYLTEDARREDEMIAKNQLRQASKDAASTPDGTFDRSHPSARRVNKLTTDHDLSIPEA